MCNNQFRQQMETGHCLWRGMPHLRMPVHFWQIKTSLISGDVFKPDWHANANSLDYVNIIFLNSRTLGQRGECMYHWLFQAHKHIVNILDRNFHVPIQNKLVRKKMLELVREIVDLKKKVCENFYYYFYIIGNKMTNVVLQAFIIEPKREVLLLKNNEIWAASNRFRKGCW